MNSFQKKKERKRMKDFNSYPKSIKKAVRYIKQDATKEQLQEIRKLIDNAIQRRNITLE
jgi:hypothetical protein